jgi:hypothetical protein
VNGEKFLGDGEVMSGGQANVGYEADGEHIGQSHLGREQASSNYLSLQIVELFERARESEMVRRGCIDCSASGGLTIWHHTYMKSSHHSRRWCSMAPLRC